MASQHQSYRYERTTTPSHTPFGEVPTEVYVSADPYDVEGLTIYPVDDQSIQGKIDLNPDRLGLVTDGLNQYIEERVVETDDIPQSYSAWEDEFTDASYGHLGIPVYTGPFGMEKQDNTSLQLCYQSKHVRAAVRILNGGGRYSQSDFAFHVGVPFSVLEHPSGAVAIAPIYRYHDTSPDESYAFVYEETETGDTTFEMGVPEPQMNADD